MFTTWVATGGTIYKRYQPFVSVTSPHFPKYYSLNQHCHLIGMLLKFDIMMLLQNYHDLQNMIIIKINLKISTIIVIIIKKDYDYYYHQSWQLDIGVSTQLGAGFRITQCHHTGTNSTPPRPSW